MIKKDRLMVGMQVIYDNGYKQDRGFVSSWDDNLVFCRFWNKDLSWLRTTVNSEGCRYEDLRAERYTDQSVINRMLKRMRSDPDYFGWREQQPERKLTTTGEGLKPCPNCLSTDLYIDGGTEEFPNFRHVHCGGCGYIWDTFDDGNFDGWNRLIKEHQRLHEMASGVAKLADVRLNDWIDELIEKGNYLEHVLRKTYEEINGHAFNNSWQQTVERIQKERNNE